MKGRHVIHHPAAQHGLGRIKNLKNPSFKYHDPIGGHLRLKIPIGYYQKPRHLKKKRYECKKF
jgi:hypothetical protein